MLNRLVIVGECFLGLEDAQEIDLFGSTFDDPYSPNINGHSLAEHNAQDQLCVEKPQTSPFAMILNCSSNRAPNIGRPRNSMGLSSSYQQDSPRDSG